MTLLGNTFDPGERYRKDPRESTEEYLKNSRYLRRGDTGSSDLLPATESVRQQDRMVGQPASTSDMATVALKYRNQQEAAKIRSTYDEIIKRKQEQRAWGAAGGQQGTNTGGQMASYGYTGPMGAQAPTNAQRQGIVAAAQSFAGSPYKLGGTTAQGIDCSGLVKAVYAKYGYGNLQHSAGWQGRNIPGVRTAVSNLQPGDIVAWKDGSHIAIYAGNGYIIDAASRTGTTTRKLWTSTDNVYGIALRLPEER